jgi:DNA processing protein
LENIVPNRNRALASRILDQGGALISEYRRGQTPYKQNFIVRNRLVSGLADAVLITEAGLGSGALHTANFAVDQGRDILVVPGSIYSPGSVGIHNLLKQSQAAPATSHEDVLEALGLRRHDTPARHIRSHDAREQAVLDLMLKGVSEGEHLLARSGLETNQFNQVLTMLEIRGLVRALGANHWSIR